MQSVQSLSCGMGEFANNIVAREIAHERRAGHVGYETPVSFHDREPSIGSGDSQIRAERQLKAATERQPVYCRDDRRRKLTLRPYGLLKAVGQSSISLHHPGTTGAVQLLEQADVDTRAERIAFARQHHCAHAAVVREPLARAGELKEHRLIQSISLRCAR